MDPVFNDAVMLAGWKENHNSGAVVSFFLPDATALDVFRGMTVRKGKVAGQRLAMCLVEIGDDEKPVQPPVTPGAAKKEPNYFASKLHADGYFRSPKLWIAVHKAGIYTLQQHKKFVETLPCCGHAFHDHQCNGDVVLHHTDGANDQAAGKALQPEAPQKGLHFMGVPVCHTYHTHAHSRALREEKQDLRTYAVQLTAKQMKEAVKRHLKITSLSDITPEMLKAFEVEIGL